jgi:uncharacterized membrane protein required for colicin V production
MAEETDDISIKVAIDSADADKSIKEIKQSLKDLKNVRAGDKLFEDAQKAAVKYREKLDDIKDAAGAASGSGVEKLTSSMNLLKEGFVNADPGKLSIAMRGLGSAMKAIPIFLLVEAIRYCVENFEELKNTSGLVGFTFQTIGAIIDDLVTSLKYFSDQLGITNFELEDNAERVVEAAKEIEEATISRYDNEIRLAKAAGKETIELEIKKQEAVIKSLQIQQKALEILASSTGEGATDEQIKKWAALEDLVKNAEREIEIIRLEAEKKANEDAKKFAEERLKIAEDNAKALRNLETENIVLSYDRKKKQIENYYEDETKKYKGQTAILEQLTIAKNNKLTELYNTQKKEEQKILDGAEKSKLKAMDNEDVAFSKFAAKKIEKTIETAKKEKEIQELSNQEILAGINSLSQSVQTILSAISDYNQAKADQAISVNERALETQLSALDVARETELAKEGLTADQKIEIENRYKQQKYQLELQEYNNNTKIKRKAFEQDKKMKIAQAVISTITGAISAVTGMISAIPGPVGIILGVVAGLAVTAAGVLQVAKINNTTFDAGTPPSPPTLTVPSAASVADSSAAATPSFDLFKKDTNQNGANNNASSTNSNQPTVVKAYVVSQEITDQQTANSYSTSMGSL